MRTQIIKDIVDKIYVKTLHEGKPFHYKKAIKSVIKKFRLPDYSQHTDIVENIRNRIHYSDSRFCSHGDGWFCLQEWHTKNIQLSLIDDDETVKRIRDLVYLNHKKMGLPI